MKMDRNVNADGMSKYALLRLRRYRELMADSTIHGLKQNAIRSALRLLEHWGILDSGIIKTPTEFFVIRLSDKYAYHAIEAYAAAASADGEQEWADECYEMLERAGRNSPWCKKPD